MKKLFFNTTVFVMVLALCAGLIVACNITDNDVHTDNNDTEEFLSFEKEFLEMNNDAGYIELDKSQNNAQNSLEIVETDNSSQFKLKRLIVQGDIKDTYGAQKKASYNSLHILSYATEMETAKAYEALTKDESLSVTIDSLVKAEGYADEEYDYSDNINWGAEAMDIGGYRQFLTDNKSAWTDREVVVVVLDTGINTSHPMFEGRLLTDENGKIKGYSYHDSKYKYSYDNLAFDADDPTTEANEGDSKKYSFEDDRGHGTHVAGIIASLTPSNVKILPIKIGDSYGFSDLSTMVAAYLRVVNIYSKQYEVVCTNLSFTGGGKTDSEECDLFNEQAYQPLLDLNILAVTAAGNNSYDLSESTSDKELKAIVVSATVEEGNGYVFDDDYSNFGTMVDVSAPGSMVTSGWIAGNDGPCDDYEQKRGTSMASPQVAGAIALLYLDPNLDEDFKATDIEDTLYDNASDMGAKGKDKYYGHGMVNLKYFEVADKNDALEIYKDGILIDKDFGDGDITDAVKIEVSCSPEFRIFYTTDSSIPSPKNGTEYTGAIFLEKPTTINFMGFKIVDGEIVEKTVLRNIEYKPIFEINEDGWIVKYNGKENHVEIPEYIRGVKITGICEEAFYYSKVQRVRMPYIQTIAKRAFICCMSLVSVEAPLLEKIDQYAFAGCIELDSFVLGENLQYIAGDAFSGTGITSFKMHPNNKNFYTDGKGIYSKSELLAVVPKDKALDYEIKGEVEIDGEKHRITTIKKHTFDSVEIDSLTIPETITKIEQYAFYMASIKNVYYNTNAEVKYHSLYYLETDLFVIGESVSMLPDYIVYDSYISNIEIRSFATEFMPYSLYGGTGEYNNLFFNFEDEIDASYVKSIASLFYGGFASIKNNIVAKSPLPVAEANELSEFKNMTTIGEYYIYGREPLFNEGKIIIATANEGGTLTPLGIQYYINGTSATYHIMPEDGYKVESIIVDGNALTKEEIYDAIANGYTFANISDNHTIDVKFVESAGKIIGKTLDIKNEMAMVFYVDLDYASTFNATMIFSKPIYADGNGGIVREDVTTVADYELTTINNQIVLKFVYRNLNAKEYGVDVTARVLVDGEVIYTTTFSVKEYAYSQLESSKNPKLNTLLVDMLNYGASAQIYFDYNTNALVNADLTEEQKAYATKEVPEAVSDVRVVANDRGKSIIDIKGATLSLENIIKIIVVVEINCNIEDFEVIVSYKNLDGSNMVKEISGSQLEKIAGHDNLYRISFTEYGVAQIGDIVSFRLVEHISGGAQVRYTYSIESYIATALENTTNVNLHTLLEAMMKYGESAKAFFG